MKNVCCEAEGEDGGIEDRAACLQVVRFLRKVCIVFMSVNYAFVI